MSVGVCMQTHHSLMHEHRLQVDVRGEGADTRDVRFADISQIKRRWSVVHTAHIEHGY